MLELGFQDKVLNWIWLILIDACWFWLMLIDSDWFLLTLIDSDWCCLMPIDASVSADAVTHSSNTSWVTHVGDHLCLSPPKCNVPIIFHLLIQHQLSMTFWWQLGVEFSGVDCEIPNYTKFSDIRFNCDVFEQQNNDGKLLKQNTQNCVFTVYCAIETQRVIRVDVTQRTRSLQILSCCHVVMVLNMTQTRGTLQVWEK